MKSLKEVVLFVFSGGFGVELLHTLVNIYKATDYNYVVVVASDVEKQKIKDYNLENYLKGIVQLDIDGTGKKTKYGYKNARKKIDEIKKYCVDYPIIFHCEGFGGGTGTGTALALSQELPNRRHMFVGPLPDFNEGRQILKNTLNNLKMMYDFGRFWTFDNRLRRSSLNYKDINRKIAEELIYVLTLPEIRTYIMRDMDTGNVLDIMFPEQYYKQGIFSFKRFKIDNLEDDISFENIQNIDDSASSKYELSYFDKIGVVIKLPRKQTLNTKVEENIERLKTWLFNNIPEASVHESVYKSNDNNAEIFLLLSGPGFSADLLKDYTVKVKELDDNFNKKYNNKELSLGIIIENDINFNKNTSDKNDLFDGDDRDKKDDLFKEDDDSDDFMDLLGL